MPGSANKKQPPGGTLRSLLHPCLVDTRSGQTCQREGTRSAMRRAKIDQRLPHETEEGAALSPERVSCVGWQRYLGTTASAGLHIKAISWAASRIGSMGPSQRRSQSRLGQWRLTDDTELQASSRSGTHASSSSTSLTAQCAQHYGRFQVG